MIELEPHEIDMVYGGDHWGYEGSAEDWAAMARSYNHGSQGFWGSSYPSCTGNVEYQNRSTTTTTSGNLSCTFGGSFPFVSCTTGPRTVTEQTSSVTHAINCGY